MQPYNNKITQKTVWGFLNTLLAAIFPATQQIGIVLITKGKAKHLSL